MSASSPSVKANGKAQDFGTATDASLVYDKKILTLTYTLPLKTPAVASRSFGIEIGDPTYFVAFTIDEQPDAIVTRDAPKGCIVRIARPPKLDPAVQQKLAHGRYHRHARYQRAAGDDTRARRLPVRPGCR